MFYKIPLSLLVILIGSLASSAVAQIAVPVHFDQYGWECWSIRDRDVSMTVQDQVASVTVTDHVANSCSRTMEIQYVFPLPPDAALDQFTLVVDGHELTGQILDANEARQVYNDIVRRSRDPGLLEYAGYGFYRSSAFPLAPGKSAELVIHYTSTCKKDGDLVELWYPMSSGRYCVGQIGHFKITADIQSQGDIVNVYSPSLSLNTDRKSPRRVIIGYESNSYRPLNDFQLFYEVSSQDVGATFLTYWPDHGKDGYYLMMVSPSPRVGQSSIQAKDIVIVLDRSGSMSGEKIQQARDAVRFVLDNLNPNDHFNFLTYNDHVTSCFESLMPATRGNIERAREHVEHTSASGGTNIYEALNTALSEFPLLKLWDRRPSYVIFLTDGLPTVGNTDESEILENTLKVNRANARVFAFGVGYDVNVRLLDNLVAQNHGRSAYVKPNESIETKVASLYTRIKNPYMTSVTASLANYGTRDDCPEELGDLFEGDQLIRVGRIYPQQYASLEQASCMDWSETLTITGTVNGEKQTFTYPVEINQEGKSSPFRFLEKLWAARRIGQLLDQIQLHGKVEEVVDELIRLSKQYGIVTPYTSFLADENRDLSQNQTLRHEATSSILSKQPGFAVGPQAQMDAATRQNAHELSMQKAESVEGYAMKLAPSNKEEYESGRREEIRTIRVVGNVTLYKKGDVWATSDAADLDPIRDRAKFTVIQRYSPEYFALVNDNTEDENKVMASQKPNEKLAIVLRGAPYLIE